MKAIYLSRGEAHGIMDLDETCQNFLAAGVPEDIVAEVRDEVTEHGYFIGHHDYFDGYEPVVVSLMHVAGLVTEKSGTGHPRVPQARAALESARAHDVQMDTDERVPTGDDYNEVVGWVRLAIDHLDGATKQIPGPMIYDPKEIAPHRLNHSLKLWYITMLWDDQPEGGSWGDTIEAVDEKEAEAIARERMADTRVLQEEIDHWGSREKAVQQFAADYHDSWTMVECYEVKPPLDTDALAKAIHEGRDREWHAFVVPERKRISEIVADALERSTMHFNRALFLDVCLGRKPTPQQPGPMIYDGKAKPGTEWASERRPLKEETAERVAGGLKKVIENQSAGREPEPNPDSLEYANELVTRSAPRWVWDTVDGLLANEAPAALSEMVAACEA